MKAGNGKHFEQAYNAQTAVDAENSYLILGKRVTNHPNDKQQLVATVESVDKTVRTVSEVSADTGYYSEDAIIELESDKRVTAYVAVEKRSHHRSVKHLEKHSEPPELHEDAGLKEKMKYKKNPPCDLIKSQEISRMSDLAKR